MVKASGTFSVNVSPQAPDENDTSGVGRLLLDKQFQGDLEATSKGQMLAMGTAIEGSAGYVAMEQVTGTLQGKSGSFALQHFGKMSRGVPELNFQLCRTRGLVNLLVSRERCRSSLLRENILTNLSMRCRKFFLSHFSSLSFHFSVCL